MDTSNLFCRAASKDATPRVKDTDPMLVLTLAEHPCIREVSPFRADPPACGERQPPRTLSPGRTRLVPMTGADYSALTRPVSKDEVRQFTLWARSSGWSRTVLPPLTPASVIGLVIAGLTVLILLPMCGMIVIASSNAGVAATALLFAVPTCLMVIGAVTAFRHGRRPSDWERRLRLREFAERNGAVYHGYTDAPGYAGMIFGVGSNRHAHDHLRAAHGRPLDIGNYRYDVKQGKSSRTYQWGFIAMQLDRRLPHMVLDATQNNLLLGSNLPHYFGKDAVLSLEGDFNRHFTLYCPPRYERDALYVFTPDLMALLIDHTSAFDVEIVDNWMFVYSTAPFDLTQPAVWQRLFAIVNIVGSKAVRQTARYADERVADRTLDVVAPQGRRMSRKVPGATLVVLGFAAFGAWIAFQATGILT
ncbi:hypothetical protein GCM10027416_24640 [Okibacterium endophyticum]